MASFYQRRQLSSPAWWDDCEEGDVGLYPVSGGLDLYDEEIYVGRVVHKGETIPGKVVPRKGCCYVTHGKKVHSYRSYQALNAPPQQCKVEWIASSDGTIPPEAVKGGQESDGTSLYIGRGKYDDKVYGLQSVLGKVHSRQAKLFIATKESEATVSNYEVLVIQDVERQA